MVRILRRESCSSDEVLENTADLSGQLHIVSPASSQVSLLWVRRMLIDSLADHPVH